MNARLAGLRGLDLVRALQKAGFVAKRISGSHHILFHSQDKARRVTVPVHSGKTVKRGTLQSILRQAKMTEDELEDLL